MLADAEPTPARVVAEIVRTRYVHLATHAFFFAEPAAQTESGTRGFGAAGRAAADPVDVLSRNPLSESGLALAGANAGAVGTLTAEELVGLNLRGVELVVLSECDTGRGAEVTGQGGVGARG